MILFIFIFNCKLWQNIEFLFHMIRTVFLREKERKGEHSWYFGDFFFLGAKMLNKNHKIKSHNQINLSWRFSFFWGNPKGCSEIFIYDHKKTKSCFILKSINSFLFLIHIKWQHCYLTSEKFFLRYYSKINKK